MRELDHHPEPVSLHDCSVCQDRGIEVESREYCGNCYRGKRRKNIDTFAYRLRGLPFSDSMWIVAHSTINTERAIAAAELALLKSKLLQAERELAEVWKDVECYRFLRNNPPTHMSVRRSPGETERGCYLDGANLDWEIDLRIDAASVAQANKEQGNG